MEEFPGNSKVPKKAAAQAPEKKVVKVISGDAVRKKKTVGQRFREVFISGEDTRSVFSYIYTEHVIPGIRDMIFDAGTAGLERKLYGESSPGARRRGSPIVSNGLGLLTNYAAASRGPARDNIVEPRISRRGRATHDFGEVIIPTRPEAELVLETMYEIIGRHEEVTVADYFQMVGETPQFTDEKWGWTNLEGSRVVRSRHGGYTIDLPQTEPLT